MLPLLVCDAIAKSYTARPLFQNISLTIAGNDRLGLIGPNGSGKTTLMRILAGLEQPDSGTVTARKLVRAGYAAQEPVFDWQKSVRQILDEAAGADAATLVPVVLGRAGFTDPDAAAGSLSGGWRKRLAIARELVQSPDLLLLDEPTNHLDLEGILWLEKLLVPAPFACVVVSHDRYFLENVATRMAEINPGYPNGLLAVEGNYSRFLEKKEEFLLAEARRQEALETRVRREIEWLRRGAKARSTKAKARIGEAGRLIGELEAMNGRAASSGAAAIEFTATGRRTKRLMWTEKIAKSMGGRRLFHDLSITFTPGMRLGLTGGNGSGKSTLLRLLTGELTPDEGTIGMAENLRVVYFDQEREQLDMSVPLRRALAPEGDAVQYRGQPIHVAGWAKRFLFHSEQLDLAVGRLSGGEQARVLIARLMLQPADILLLDEPTNDLDIPALEVLEESLLDFPGSLVLVTHDRYMLDRVSNLVLGLDGEGGAAVFADYTQWAEAQVARKQARTPAARASSASAPRPAAAGPKKKLSYLDQREFEQMEAKILSAEQQLATAQTRMQAPETVSDPQALSRCYAEVQSLEAALNALYERWAELESLAG